MQAEATPTVVAVLNDLMFQVRIEHAAKHAGRKPLFVKSQAEALALAQQMPSLIIVDLNYSPAQPLELIDKLRANERTRSVPLLGYVSHVQTDLRRQAVEHGCDVVVARSKFVDSLPELLSASGLSSAGKDPLSSPI